MHLNIFRTKRIEEIINEMDLTEFKVISDPNGKITFMDLGFTPREENADGDDKRTSGCLQE